jgi:heme-degrading monooxygenase HmoA
MTVVVTVTVKVDPEVLRGLFESKREVLAGLGEVAKSAGALHHRFTAGDGEVLILDEWESAEAFQQFFGSQPEIAAIMQEAGVQEPPDIRVWQPMDDAPDIF